MSERGGEAYTFNSHRDALYRVLEAAARGHAGCADECLILGSDKGEGEEKKWAYPTPFLWYEEIRPSDIDAYHAANHARCTSGCNNNRDDSPLSSSTSPPTSGFASSGVINRSGVGLKEATAVDADRASDATAAAAAQHVLGEKPDRLFSGSGGPLARTPDQNLRPAVLMHRPYNTHSCRYRPDDTAGMHGEEGRQEEGATRAAASIDYLSNADGRCSSEAGQKKKESCCPLTMTRAPTPPDPSQATQTMFLPGLPSQVLVTQQQEQQGDAAGWEYSEEDESSQRAEDTPPVSEYALSLPNHDRLRSSTQENAFKGASVASAGDRQVDGDRISRPGPDRNKSKSIDPPVVLGDANGPVAATAAREREEVCSRHHDAFTRALRDFVGQEQSGKEGDDKQAGPAQSAARDVSYGGGGTSSGGGDRSQPPFTFLSTQEVLPSGWPGGQGGVVTFLEKQLSHARKRCPGGYAARALELACHVLRQPTVCVKAVECRGGNQEPTRAAAARRADFFAGAATDYDDPQVVGVAGFVWEMLRANDGDSANLAQQAVSVAQEG